MTKDAIPTTSISFTACFLYRLAVEAYRRLTPDGDDRVGARHDAIVSVLFSAATTEAIINEVEVASGIEFGLKKQVMSNLNAVLSEVESSRGSVRLKYLIAKQVLTGSTYDKGAAPYQDWDLLIALRDAIVHMKPETNRGDPHKLLQRLLAKGLCEAIPDGVHTSWFQAASTRAVARWACNTACDMIDSLATSVPDIDGTNISLMHGLFRGTYTRVT